MFDGIMMYSVVYNYVYQVHVMGHVPYVGRATRSRATVITRFAFCIKKKKKKRSSQKDSNPMAYM
jgi:hypothetical protein